VPFPFRIPKAEKEEDQIDFESWLAEREPTKEDYESVFGLKTNEKRKEWQVELLGVSEACLRDALGGLDVGNALEYTNDGGDVLDSSANELLDVVSGRSVLAGQVRTGRDSETRTYGPWSARYAGQPRAHAVAFKVMVG
jgi:hypothetical protein